MTDPESPLSTPPENVLAARARLGEGPVWDAEAGVLWWVDIYNHRVHRFDPAAGEDVAYEAGETVGAVAPAAGGRLLLALRCDLAFLDPESGRVERAATVLPRRPGLRFNDGKCDPRGRFWIGSMSAEEGGAALYRFDPDGSVRTVETGLTISNGLGWSPDARVFYLTDTPARRIYAYDFDADRGEISGRRVFADLAGEELFPDGLAVDREGCVWSAQWDGGCVIRFAPDGGELLRVRMPVPRPTSCAFGGSEGEELYVTSASIGLGEEEVEAGFESGDLFRLRPGVAGLPVPRFGGEQPLA
ncbi:MAG TPA: SMP-30/gluconolactonase/LRE family protein [Longimicrobiaceae bacterium]|nr:SMP-30/gluconolactonase/LRE family protein [Longimicrobiaceae bacterium]